MRVFVCEFVTGGGFRDVDLPPGLRQEGDMMLASLVKDLADIPGVSVVAARDDRLPAPAGAIVHRVAAGKDPWSAWRRIMDEADAVLPVAPETDGLLERLSSLVLSSGCQLLGSRPEAVACAASKLRTAERLAERGLPVVPTPPLARALAGDLPSAAAGWVAKPDDGAGCEETFLLPDRDAVRSWAAGRDAGRFVIQPYLPGRATSLSLLCAEEHALLLSCNGQEVQVTDGRFHYQGGLVGGAEAERPGYEDLAAGIARALPGLWGLVGVDLVETAGGSVVLEVNPRVTTSYVGLRQFLGRNPAELLLLLARDGWTSLNCRPPAGREAPVPIHVAA